MAITKSQKQHRRGFFPNMKRPKLDVIQEFPDWRGSHASLMHQRTCKDGDGAVLMSRNSSVKLKQSFQNRMTFSTASRSSDTARENEELTIDGVADTARENEELTIDGVADTARENEELTIDGVADTARENEELTIDGVAEKDSRERMKVALNMFHHILTKVQDSKRDSEKRSNAYGNINSTAIRLLFEQEKWAIVPKCIGSIAGVEVGDKFQCRAELQVVGLHHQHICGIDYMEKDGKLLATSIVSSGRYENSMTSSDSLIYSGEGGNPLVGCKLVDQKLERGNLALINSKEEGVPIRVIYCSKIPKASSSISFSGKELHDKMFVYDGLYLVDNYWQVRGQFGKLIFQFLLKRMSMQGNPFHKKFFHRRKSSHVPFHKKFVHRIKSSGVKRHIVLVNDISQGKEDVPIPCKNTIDEEKPSRFDYITDVISPQFFEVSSPNACVTKNGGTIPNNSMVCKCTTFCKCSSCIDRVTQSGISYRLEVFRTRSKRWGVRSTSSIQRGSFVCEYIGEVLHDKEAEKRIENTYRHHSHEAVSTHFLSFSQAGTFDVSNFTIDATLRGNVGRFVGHSSSPNLRPQYVSYDHVDVTVPHIMLFAIKDIPPLKELTIDYSDTMAKFGMQGMKPP